MVAVMSRDISTPEMTEVPSASAAQISSRCAMLLEAGIRTVPCRRDGVIRMFMHPRLPSMRQIL